ncbi:DNA-binding protein [Granulicatella sp. zg-ZJ]|uniref:HU family DNA-binding protein n=1 Tax=unclassified Granulicatella TaxID=2630493 RepID=UPI0013C0FAF5|nr:MULTISPECIES: HU family DNA-binding protein [unclassified Granulicatella]MBS4750670.1 HU family DNA-binding protein [Carnobacteriaceae bacterium zg-ZUI78]NEW63443.1 DNA-binding protein [Granulicatella sp. zg-ZJ]NEW66446.1 DNA-binding protein [Granulicatella sp. zg-84]QMI86350.1 HU family DNA-binding protein [Carnobacteriaceae bacterium zg-84]
MANKAELVERVANETGFTKKDVAITVDALFESIQEILAAGQKVQIIGFGNFEVRERAARKGRNPQTGEEIEIKASKVPGFKAGKALKDAVK